MMRFFRLFSLLTIFALIVSCGGGGGGGDSNKSSETETPTGDSIPRIVYFTVTNPSLEETEFVMNVPANRFNLDYKVENVNCTGRCLKLITWHYPCTENCVEESNIPVDPSTELYGIIAEPYDNRTCEYIFPDETFKFKMTLIAAEGVSADTWVEIYPYRTRLLWLYGYLSDRPTRGPRAVAVRWANGVVKVYDETNYPRLQEVLNAWNEAIGGIITLVPTIDMFKGEINIWQRPKEGIVFDFLTTRINDDNSFSTVTVGVPFYSIEGVTYYSEGNKADDETAFRTYMHVIGHALGFYRHTKNGGLMSDPPGTSQIGELEKTFMRYLYSLPPGEEIVLEDHDMNILRNIGYD